MSLTLAQAKAAHASGSVSVIAGAGTGKTHMLSERYAYWVLERGLSPLQLVAVTFTEKAAEELRRRVRSRLVMECQDDAVLVKLSAAPMSTIHALCARIIRQHPAEAGMHPSFSILEESSSVLWIQQQERAVLTYMPQHWLERFPFRVLRGIIDAVRFDAEGVQRSLALSREERNERWETMRQQALDSFRNHPEVVEIRRVLENVSGPAGDKREVIRQTVLTQMEALSHDEAPDCAAWKSSIKLTGGSKKAWGEAEFVAAGDALKQWRNIVEEQGKGPLGWEETPFDALLEEALPDARDLSQFVLDFFDEQKKREGVLDYNDLERGALRALQHDSVQAFYESRWKVFFIDEFQDTNPVQSEIIERLTRSASVTIVGDPNQSIYGFRRAEPRLFSTFEGRIEEQGGEVVSLDTNFRTHEALVSSINRISSTMLDPYVNLDANRIDAPHEAPHIEAFTIEAESSVLKPYRVQMEAACIAERVQSMLESGLPVHDAEVGLRPIEPRDIVILSRTWAPLQIYGEALQSRQVPVSSAAGGSLFQTREAKDIITLLQFLADSGDDSALVAVLRSPWFALSDPVLFEISEARTTGQSWWNALASSEDARVAFAVACLRRWLACAMETPSALLIQMADQDTGYSAALAHLPGAPRRLSDWAGMIELLSHWQEEAIELHEILKRIEAIQDAEIDIARPGTEATNTVSLMTIHASKGLEWPVVFLPDLTRARPNSSNAVAFDPEIGFAFRFTDDAGETQKPILFRMIDHERSQREAEEQKRLLYVAMTRARDHIVLSANETKGGIWNELIEPLQWGGVAVEVRPYEEQVARQNTVPSHPETPTPYETLLEDVGCGLTELPATALSLYVQCPKRFRFRFVDGYPEFDIQAVDGGYGRRMGNVVHAAMEYDTLDEERLRVVEPGLPAEALHEAIRMARSFYEADCFTSVRSCIRGRETPVMTRWVDDENPSRQVVVNGIIDATGITPEGTRFVLDYKTDQRHEPEHHEIQVWLYTQAIRAEDGYLAYVNDSVEGEPRLVHFSKERLEDIGEKANQVFRAILADSFEADPHPTKCAHCPYASICEDKQA